MDRQALAATRSAAVAIAAVVAVVVLRPDVAALRRIAHRPQAWVDSVGADRAAAVVAGLVLWLLAVVLSLGFASALVAGVPGTVGALADRVSRLLLPAVLRRTIATAAGVGVMLAPVAAGARDLGGARAQQYTPAATTPAATTPAATTPAATTPAATTPAATATPPAAIPAPAWPTTPAQSPRPRPSSTPAPSVKPSGTHRPAPPARHPAPPPAATATVVVSPGDSLWLIASRRLGPAATDAAISAEWRRWYAANRGAVGADPNVIHPGLSLHAPPLPSRTTQPEES